jgi:hypothetical protein
MAHCCGRSRTFLKMTRDSWGLHEQGAALALLLKAVTSNTGGVAYGQGWLSTPHLKYSAGSTFQLKTGNICFTYTHTHTPHKVCALRNPTVYDQGTINILWPITYGSST